MDREEEMIKDFESAANCKYNDDARSLILSAMQWADEHPRKGLVDINKACDWLKENVQDYTDDGYGEHTSILIHDLVEHFHDAMED